MNCIVYSTLTPVQLFTLAEPELSGLRQERHAKTIEIAQKEVLTCIGLALFDRFVPVM